MVVQMHSRAQILRHRDVLRVDGAVEDLHSAPRPRNYVLLERPLPIAAQRHDYAVAAALEPACHLCLHVTNLAAAALLGVLDAKSLHVQAGRTNRTEEIKSLVARRQRCVLLSKEGCLLAVLLGQTCVEGSLQLIAHASLEIQTDVALPEQGSLFEAHARAGLRHSNPAAN